MNSALRHFCWAHPHKGSDDSSSSSNSSNTTTTTTQQAHLLTDDLQPRQEALGQVAVLEHHPEAVRDALVDPALSNRALTLTQGDGLNLWVWEV